MSSRQKLSMSLKQPCLLQVLQTWSHAGRVLTVGPGREYPHSALGALSALQVPRPTLVLGSGKSLLISMSLSPHYPEGQDPLPQVLEDGLPPPSC